MLDSVLSRLVWRDGSQANQFLMAFMITVPVLSFGMMLGWLSPMAPLLQSTTGPAPEPITDDIISWMASVTFIVVIPGAFLAGALADRYGRKPTMLATSFCMIVSWLITMCSLRPWALILARAVAGGACSGCFVVSPLYLKEISDDNIRGALGSFFILFQNFGYLIMYVIGDLLEFTVVMWICILVPIVHFLLFLVMPETPVFLVKQKKVEEAKNVVAWLRSTRSDDAGIIEEVRRLEKEGEDANSMGKASWKSIVCDKTTFKAFRIAVTIMISQETCGFLVVLMYAGSIFTRASESISLSLSPNKQAIVLGVVQLLGSVLASCIVEKTGRKWLLAVTSLLTGLAMLVLGLWFYLTTSMWLPGWVPIAAMCLCIFCDAAGYQPVPYVIMSELFSFQHRGMVTSFAIVCCTISDFIQTKAFEPLSKLIGIYWVFIFFAVWCFLGTLYTVLWVPETREKSLEEIYEVLGKNKKVKAKDVTVEEHRF